MVRKLLAGISIAAVLAGVTFAADIKISALPAVASALSTTDLLIANEGATTRKATPPQVVAASVSGNGLLNRTGSTTVSAYAGTSCTNQFPRSLSAAGAATCASVATADLASTFYEASTFTPTVTLVGGAGNTVPVYTTNTGRYTRIGNKVSVHVLLTGDGGAEGAGSGVVNVALPIAASASELDGGITNCGIGVDNATIMLLTCAIAASASTVKISYWITISSVGSVTGSLQGNTTRTLSLRFWYEV